MIQSMCLLEDAKCLLAYDGKTFVVLGDSPISSSIRALSDGSRQSLFLELMEGAADDFDPVRYWYESSMNFAMEDPPVPYDEHLFREYKKRLESLR